MRFGADRGRRCGARAAARAALLLGLGAVAASCEAEPDAGTFTAPPSRHDALASALRQDADALAFRDGDWLDDLGDAPFYGLAWLSRAPRRDPLSAEEEGRRSSALARSRALVEGAFGDDADVSERVMAAFGLVESFATTGDDADRARLGAFLDRLEADRVARGDDFDLARGDAEGTFGFTAARASVALLDAQAARVVGGAPSGAWLARAVAIEGEILNRALGDLVTPTGPAVRAYARAPGDPRLDLTPNLAMIELEAELFRATRDEARRLRARAAFAAVQSLKASDVPTRYASPSTATLLGDDRDAVTLFEQDEVVLALLAMFAITGERRFVEEADRALDSLEAFRGPYCASMLHAGACAPTCAPRQACDGASCAEDRCTSGLREHVVRGRPVDPERAPGFCAGCTLRTRYVVGARRALAGEPF